MSCRILLQGPERQGVAGGGGGRARGANLARAPAPARKRARRAGGRGPAGWEPFCNGPPMRGLPLRAEISTANARKSSSRNAARAPPRTEIAPCRGVVREPDEPFGKTTNVSGSERTVREEDEHVQAKTNGSASGGTLGKKSNGSKENQRVGKQSDASKSNRTRRKAIDRVGKKNRTRREEIERVGKKSNASADGRTRAGRPLRRRGPDKNALCGGGVRPDKWILSPIPVVRVHPVGWAVDGLNVPWWSTSAGFQVAGIGTHRKRGRECAAEGRVRPIQSKRGRIHCGAGLTSG
jgi:hypothetical protein